MINNLKYNKGKMIPHTWAISEYTVKVWQIHFKFYNNETTYTSKKQNNLQKLQAIHLIFEITKKDKNNMS